MGGGSSGLTEGCSLISFMSFFYVVALNVLLCLGFCYYHCTLMEAIVSMTKTLPFLAGDLACTTSSYGQDKKNLSIDKTSSACFMAETVWWLG